MDPTGTRPAAGALVLESEAARVVVRPQEGGRLGSVVVAGQELLVTSDPQGPIHWGSYPMAPWAGRVRNGRFSFDGHAYQLPLGMPPHAIHGVVFDRPWTVADATTIRMELDERWPFRGHVEQRFELDEDGLTVTMTLVASEPMPAVIGWHPWFRRSLAQERPSARLTFEAGAMLVRDEEGIPSGERVPPPVGPWDDAFTDLRTDPVLEWPGQLRLELSSSCPWWVVYDVPQHAICVEPQSGPPDAVNRSPEIVAPGSPLVHVMRWRWDTA